MRVSAALLAVVCLAFAAAGCGSSGKKTGATTVATTMTPAQEKARIKQVWTEFFSSKTSPQQKARLLQNGVKFGDAIDAQAKSPLAKKVSATVTSVTLQGPAKAKVVYTVDLAGQPALKNATGTAVKVNGQWLVGDDSFCKLLALGGQAPAGCKNVG